MAGAGLSCACCRTPMFASIAWSSRYWTVASRLSYPILPERSNLSDAVILLLRVLISI